MVDVAVVGRGLVGSAAARHLAAAGVRVALVGPREPEDPARAAVFASHYDQGRVLRHLGKDALWTELHVNSIRAFRALEAETGVSFLRPVGCLLAASDPAHSWFATAFAFAQAWGVAVEEVAPADPRLGWRVDAARAALEPAPAGVVEPRGLVRAQVAALESLGGLVVDDVVTGLQRAGSGWRLRAAAELEAEVVVVAAGAFTTLCGLVPGLDVRLESETVLLAEVGGAPDPLPSLLYEVETDRYEGVYATPPLRYPDGRVWLKLGCNLPSDRNFEDLEAARRWFVDGPGRGDEPVLREIVHGLLPSATIGRTLMKPCIVTRTVTGRPFVGSVDDGLVVATGGNGYGAMASDALGALAAAAALGGPVSEALAPRFR